MTILTRTEIIRLADLANGADELRIVTEPDHTGWKLEVCFEGDWYTVVGRCSIWQAIYVQRVWTQYVEAHYFTLPDDGPEVIETAWGDPVCCN